MHSIDGDTLTTAELEKSVEGGVEADAGADVVGQENDSTGAYHLHDDVEKRRGSRSPGANGEQENDEAHGEQTAVGQDSFPLALRHHDATGKIDPIKRGELKLARGLPQDGEEQLEEE